MKNLAIAASLAAATAAANAGVTSIAITEGSSNGVTGAIVRAPEVVGKDNFNDMVLRAYDELQNITLQNDITVGGSTIRAGTVVDSHAVFWDPARGDVHADIAFTGDILGVAVTLNEIRDTNFAKLPTQTILEPSALALEGHDDYAFIGNILTVDFRATSPGDLVRVFTAAVPTPGAAAAFGLAGLTLVRRRR